MEVNLKLDVPDHKLVEAINIANLPYDAVMVNESDIRVTFPEGEPATITLAVFAHALADLASRAEGAPKLNTTNRQNILNFFLNNEDSINYEDLSDRVVDYALQTAVHGAIKFKPAGSRWHPVEAD